ncbi:unnamed protein product [Linum trigynum]|uniref:Uncharacterized protein n=1 Tax=Linum trigynum TaxID=586398 RepID=A0AAV2G415_9ROSI
MASPSSTTKSHYSLASFAITSPRLQCRRRPLTFRAHGKFPDEGSSGWPSDDGVDANLGVLRDRIEAVQIKERLQLTCSAVLRSASLRMMTRPPPQQSTSSTCSRVDHGRNINYGWNYGGDHEQLVNRSRRRRRQQRSTQELAYQFCRLVALVSSTIGVTCLSGTCLLYLVSILAHHFSH